MYCLVPGCLIGTGNGKFGGVMIHRLPKDADLVAAWIQATRREDEVNLKNACVCAHHFKADDYERDMKFELLNPGKSVMENPRRRLKKTAVPSQNIPGRNNNDNVRTDSQYQRLRDRRETMSAVFETASGTAADATMSTTTSIPESVQSEIADLKARIISLESELKMKNEEVKKCKTGLESLFTEQQIQCLLFSKRPYPWKEETIIKALEFRVRLSRHQYEFLRSTGFPLPSLSTLQTWLKKFTVRPGDARSCVDMLSKFLANLPERERACIVMYDEMSVSNSACYDSQADVMVGPHGQLMQVLIRSVVGDWKFPVYFQFDEGITAESFRQLVKDLETSGARIVGAVSDMGPKNRALWTQLGVDGQGDTYVTHPADASRRIWMFADTPHLLKLLRNYVLDEGFNLPGGGRVDKELLADVLAIDGDREFKLLPKLGVKTHLEVKGQARQRVRPAAQVLSASVATATELFYPDKKKESDFIRLVNDTFDVLNGLSPGDPNAMKRGLGRDDDARLQVLADFERMIQEIQIGNRCSDDLLPFQKGFLMTIKSIRGLVGDMHALYGPDVYVLPGRVNQDILESFFSLVRGKGGANFNPTPVEAKCRVRNLVLMYALRLGINPVDGTTHDVLSPDAISETDFFSDVEQQAEQSSADVAEMSELLRTSNGARPPRPETAQSRLVSRDPETGVTAEQYAMAHAAGYISAKCRRVDSSLGTPSSFADEDAPVQTMWTRLISHGGLSVPSQTWLNTFAEMETIFCSYHHNEPDGLSRKPGVIGDLVRLLVSRFASLDARIIRKYARLRTFIRLGSVNRRRQKQKQDDTDARREKRKRKQFLMSK